MTDYRKPDAYWPPQFKEKIEDLTAAQAIMAIVKRREQECEDLCEEVLRLRAEIKQLKEK